MPIRTANQRKARPLEIEAAAKRRLADEYDAAQARGEVKTVGNPSIVPDGNNRASADELGLTRKDIHESRRLRDAEGVPNGNTLPDASARRIHPRERRRPRRAAAQGDHLTFATRQLKNHDATSKKHPNFSPANV